MRLMHTSVIVRIVTGRAAATAVTMMLRVTAAGKVPGLLLRKLQESGTLTMANTSRRRHRVIHRGLLLQAVLLVVWQLTDHLDLSIHRMTSATNALNLGIVRTIALAHWLLAVSDGGT